MTAGPFPVPEGVNIDGKRHGEAVTFSEALELAGLPDFPDVWAIVPDATGDGLRLMWADACSIDELDRSCDWNREALAYVRASDTPRGTA